MFSTSIGLLLVHLLAYIVLPLIPGMIALRILAGNRIRGWQYYLLSWFLGVGVLGYGLFLLQFARFGIDRIAYLILLAFLFVILLVRIKFSDMSWKKLFHTLQISCKCDGWKEANTKKRAQIFALVAFIVLFAAASFFFVSHFPSYADDAFGNRHNPIMNILYDGGIKIFGVPGEILGRGRLGYPIMIPAMQAFISNVIGGYNDIYVNLYQWLSLIFFGGFIGSYVYQKRKNLVTALIGPALVISLPLIFMHATQGYMDMISAIYTAIAVVMLYEWLLEDGDRTHLYLGVASLAILSYVKNDGFVVYMMGTIIALAIYFVIHRKSALNKLHIFKKPMPWVTILSLILFFIIPFTYLKSHYNLGFNQAAGVDAGLGLASSIHWEIFPALWKTMRSLNNFSVAPLLMLFVIVLWFIHRKRHQKETAFLILAPVVIMALFIAVFLFTENYKFVLDQTTSNRVFTMVFIIFFSYIGLLRDTHKHH